MEISIRKEKMENSKKPIRGFQDLRVYQNLYKAMILVLTKIVSKLPKEEKYDLGDQLSRACKAAPAILAEGFAKRYQKRAWKKYIEDVIGECNEMVHHLSVCRDIYGKYLDRVLVEKLIEIYDVSCRQLHNLKEIWRDFHEHHKY